MKGSISNENILIKDDPVFDDSQSGNNEELTDSSYEYIEYDDDKSYTIKPFVIGNNENPHYNPINC